MPPKKTPPPAAVWRSLVAPVGRGLGGALLGALRVVVARPILFGGTAMFLLVGGMVATNALSGQAVLHPYPMLATRAVDATGAIAAASAGRPAAPQPWRPHNDPRVMTVPLVRDVQTLLAHSGYYEAEIDGRPGQATDRAIRTFQAERGLRVDGMATPLLLTQIRQAVGPIPATGAGESGEGETEFASLDDLMGALPDTGADIPILDEEPADPDMVRRIQAGLSGASVATLTADGIMGSQTRAAIRAFQELEGLEVTGEPSLALLERLDALEANP